MQPSSHESSISKSDPNEGTCSATQLSLQNKKTFAEMAQKIMEEAQRNKNVKKVRIRVRVRRMVKGGKIQEGNPKKISISGEMAAKLLKQRVIALKQRRDRHSTAKHKLGNNIEPGTMIDLTSERNKKDEEEKPVEFQPTVISQPTNASMMSQSFHHQPLIPNIVPQAQVMVPNYMLYPTTLSHYSIRDSFNVSQQQQYQTSVPIHNPYPVHFEYAPQSFYYVPQQPIIVEEPPRDRKDGIPNSSQSFSDHFTEL